MTKSALLGAFALAIGFAITPAIAADTATFGHPVDLSSVRANIQAHNYAAALSELRDLAATHPDADVYNLLGFVLRKTGDYKNSWIYYTKALEMEPNHKGARSSCACPSGGRTPASTNRSSTVQITIQSACLASSHRLLLRARRSSIAYPRHFAVAAPPSRIFRNPQIPIASRSSPRVRAWAVSSVTHARTSDL